MTQAACVLPGRRIPDKPAEAGFRKAEPMLDDGQAYSALATLSKRRGSERFDRFAAARDELARDFGASIGLVRTDSGLRVAASYAFITTDKTINPDLDYRVSSAGFRLTLSITPVVEGTKDERYERVERTCTKITGVLLVEKTGEDGKPLKGKDGKNRYDEIPLSVTDTFVSVEQRMHRVYTIREREYASADFTRVAESAEKLLGLLRSLRPPMHEDLPVQLADVVPITSARTSRAPPAKEDAAVKAS
ncbi:MAG: hypothetical protein AB1324_03390 [Candidatus Micrarchaeota archaeon]